MLTILRMALVIIWWFVSAHKWFKGPKINIEVRTFQQHTTMINTNSPSMLCSVERRLLWKVSRAALIVMLGAMQTRRRKLQDRRCPQLK